MKRIDNLDNCRAIAILLVIFSHLGQSWQRSGLIDQDNLLFRLSSVGAHGVELFFIISGYLMSLIYTKGGFRTSTFICRRAARIAPLWFFYLSVWVVIHLVLNTSPLEESIVTWILLILIASSITADASNSFLQGNFSISNEWLFYLAFPILRKFRTGFLLFLGIICTLFAISLKLNAGFYSDVPSQLTEQEKYVGIFGFWNALPFFVLGILLERHLVKESQIKSSTLNLLGVCIVTYCFGVFALSLDSYREIWAPLLLLIFIFVLNSPEKLTILSWLGQRSYGIFFAHFLVIGGYERAIAALGHSLEPVSALIQIVFVLIVSSFVAELTWKYLEKPIITTTRRKFA
jgi:exopolysaccharide production protein ExoZ